VAELSSEPRELELLTGEQETADCLVEGVELSTLNITAGLSLGLLMGVLGDACIRQVLNPERGGPLGPKPVEGERG
jgi:hypothetical protein